LPEQVVWQGQKTKVVKTEPDTDWGCPYKIIDLPSNRLLSIVVPRGWEFMSWLSICLYVAHKLDAR